MIRVFALATASVLALSAPAFAQSTAPGQPTPPAQTTPGTMPNAKVAPGAGPSAGPSVGPNAGMTIPAQSMSMNEWIRQGVYDGANNKIGDIADVLLDSGAQAKIAVLGVGGFLGIGEKNVAVPFASIKRSVRDGKVYLTMDANKDSLKAAQGLRFDRVTNSWVPDTNSSSNPPVRQ